MARAVILLVSLGSKIGHAKNNRRSHRPRQRDTKPPSATVVLGDSSAATSTSLTERKGGTEESGALLLFLHSSSSQPAATHGFSAAVPIKPWFGPERQPRMQIKGKNQ